MKNKIWLLLLISGGFFYACNSGDYTPKPKGYFRIDLPEKQWEVFDSLEQFRFDYPDYAVVSVDQASHKGDTWVDIYYTPFNAVLHLSYKVIAGNFNTYVEDTRTLALQHLPKANTINDSVFYLPDRAIAGIMYQIGGKGVASPIQFYASDSTRHFIRGALYFNFRPNNDSIAPVIQYVKHDLLHFIRSIEWKEE